jgi:hypothetical protein
MEAWIKIIKQHGVTGLLTLWLWVTHNKVEKLEMELYNCLKESGYRNKAENKTNSQTYYAIIPKDYLGEKIKKLRG